MERHGRDEELNTPDEKEEVEENRGNKNEGAKKKRKDQTYKKQNKKRRMRREREEERRTNRHTETETRENDLTCRSGESTEVKWKSLEHSGNVKPRWGNTAASTCSAP